MNEKIFDIILLCIPVIGAIISGFIIPYLKTKISVTQMDEITKWVAKAVQATEVMFDTPQSGTEKKEYVINFIDNMFNSKKEVISRQQIEILLEAAWKQMTET
mgnify:CR=1 FL=1